MFACLRLIFPRLRLDFSTLAPDVCTLALDFSTLAPDVCTFALDFSTFAPDVCMLALDFSTLAPDGSRVCVPAVRSNGVFTRLRFMFARLRLLVPSLRVRFARSRPDSGGRVYRICIFDYRFCSKNTDSVRI